MILISSIEPNSKKHRNIEKSRFGSIELIKIIQMHHVKSFKCNKTENSKKYRNIVRVPAKEARKILEFHSESEAYH
jgi:hypothetical protein